MISSSNSHHRFSVLRLRRTQTPRRDGLAVTELAICLPLLTLLAFGTLETCRGIYLRQNLSVVAYEGARIGIIPGSTEAAVRTQCEMLLDDRGIKNYTVEMSPAIANLEAGDLLTVTVTADCDSNSMVSNLHFQGRTINESVTLRAE